MALVGAVGSGKTTLTALVPRLHDVTGGRILLGGVDIRELRLDQLRHAVTTAFEEATLFSASVRENLTLGRAGVADDDVTEAIEVAQAGFVHDLPFGLDTRIGEQGLSLSGGQRQRLALARRGARPAPGAGARRPALGAGRAHRGAGRGGAAPGARVDHRAGRGAPAVHRAAGRPGGAARRTAGSPPSARTASCWPRVPAYRNLLSQSSELTSPERRSSDAEPS